MIPRHDPGSHLSRPSPFALNPNLQLTYHGGPIEHNPTLFLIFWQPTDNCSGSASGSCPYPSGYQSTIEQFAQDIAADSGKTSNAYGAIAQYGDTNGAGSYSFTYGGAATFTGAIDTSGCNGMTSNASCVTDAEVRSAVLTEASANHWPLGLSSEFAVMTPPNVVECDPDPEISGCSDQVYCSYHGEFPNSMTPVVYLAMPAEPEDACHTPDGITIEPAPNGPAVDTLIDDLSHESREAATDPEGTAWFDADGFEADDKCIDSYGSLVGSNYNQPINGHTYDTQLEWSNALKGCYQMGTPTVSLDAVSGAPGSTIGITGTNFFGAFPNKPTVKFNGVAATSVTVDSPTHLTVTVPSGNTVGHVTVTAIGGTGTSAQSFGAPAVTGLSETSGHAGDVVTVSGSDFVGVTHVTVGGVAATFSMVASNGMSLKAVVPVAAVDGPFAVTNAEGTGTGSDTFTVLPTVTSFTPTSGAAGTSVTIDGSGFGAANGVTFVGDGDADGIPVSSGVNQIVVQVPTNTELGPITVHTHSGADNATSSGSFAPLPSITGFDHVNYQPGGTAQVLGANFTANGPVSVAVNGVTACTSCTATATSVTFTVPNTVSGTVTVTNGDGSATSASPLLIRPRIDGVNGSGGSGTIIVLAGAGFGGTTSVAFGDNTEAAAFAVAAGGAALRVTVPAGATTGKIGVTNAGGTTLTASDYTIPATISSFAPLSAAAGVNMLINGNGLTGSTEVDFAGGASAVPTDVTATSLRVVVPSGAVTGPISVHTSSGVVTTTRPLVIALSITNVNPGSGPGTTGVTITGTGFTGRVTSVKFNGVSADFTVVSATQITAIVPTGATTGPITVTANGLTVTSAAPFTVT